MPHDHLDAGLVEPSSELSQSRERRLKITLTFNVIIVAVQVVFGFYAHSLGLISDAGHNLADVGAIFLSLVAVRLIRRSPTQEKSFGYHRAGVLAAQANAATILLMTGFIVVEGINRIIHPEHVRGGIVVIVALVGATANFACVLLLREKDHGHNHDMNMHSAVLHLISDGAASIGVAGAGGVILVTGKWQWLDPAASLIIAALIAIQAWKLFRAANEVLLESTPRNIKIDDMTAYIMSLAGVEDMHDLHVWSLSPQVNAMSAHLIIEGHPSLEEAQVVGNYVKKQLTENYSIAHATLELECEDCADDASPNH